MRRRLLFALWITAFLLGFALRAWNLPDQVVGGDELHGVRAALDFSLTEILSTYRDADPSIPLAAFYHLVIGLRGFLTEWMVRLPSMVSGLLALVLIPWLARRRLGLERAVLLAWLLALSPLLVLYSRLGRPYMPIVLLTFVAFLAFDRWAEGSGERGASWWAVLWALCAGLSIWFHLVTAPFVLAPWLFELARGLFDLMRGFGARLGKGKRHRPGPSLPALLGFGALAALVAAVLVGPGFESLVEVLRQKEGGSTIGGEALAGVWYLQAGTARGGLAIVFWALAILGLGRLLREQPRFAARGLFSAGALVVAVWVLSPWGVANPLVLNRYWLVLLPLVFCWITAVFPLAADRSEEAPPAAARLRPAWTVAASLLVIALAWGGPLLNRAYATSSFTQSNDYVAFHLPRPAVPGLPPALAGLSEPGPILVFPWPSPWRLNRVQALYQQAHGRSVVVASPEGPLNRAALRFRNLSAATPEAFLASRARFLVVFLDPAAEDRRIEAPAPKSIYRPGQARRYRRQAELMVDRLRGEWGEPLAEDGRVVIWDLEAIRPRGGQG